ncbi:hypothetical protein [Thalassotalea sp. PP2-459]|uniref:hypothetical protein n=1 Tax=Thalassotalea sp. PP2-459 TaxID=1742724 RepID=UPI000945C056|nr:hypothetical protein [Thalassotalea sp. PP2-459]OKY25231.1 hypothetical protein BI291_17170 [Thalassotalea sp. PP2-459]
MTKLTSNNYFHLRCFYHGLSISYCIELCSGAFERFTPSESIGVIIKRKDLRPLKVNGLIEDRLEVIMGVRYLRYSISDLGIKVFEEYKNDCSK